MQSFILINKPLCFTPLQVINDFKEKYPEYRDQTISYAGRLDPMAEGLMLLLVAEENKRRKLYEDLPKTYEFSLVLGIATDTYDLMGKITAISTEQPAISSKKVEEILPSFLGEQTLPYPPYSSRTVNGKPLYWYARRNKLQTIEIPRRKVHISKLSLLSPRPQRSRVSEAGGSTLLPTRSLLNHIFRIIPEVQGNFRQDEILQIWRNTSPRFPAQLPHFSFTMTCTSGTYVRQIVHEIGEKLRVPTVTSSIKRVRIGDYLLKDALQSSA